MTKYYGSYEAECDCVRCKAYGGALAVDGPESIAQLDQLHSHIDHLVNTGRLSKDGPVYQSLIQKCVDFTWSDKGPSGVGYATQPKPQPNKWLGSLAFGTAATQKVRGLKALATISQYVGTSVAHLETWSFIAAKDIVAEPFLANQPGAQFRALSYPLFLRPCPVTPRHGFVDSRLVHRPEEMVHIAEEAIAADPDAELLITPFIEADHSAVLTPTTFSYGDGHDGATSGKSTTVYGPGVEADTLNWIKQEATIAGDDVPYIELVGLNMVQARGGPQLESVQDYVPEDITVTQVLTATADTDLLVWEKEIANAQPGTVVYADGLSLASHFCVHAVVNKVPVLTTKRPRVTDFIEKTDVPVWTHKDWRRLAKFMTEADRVMAHTGVDGGWAKLAVSALHCAGTPSPATDPQLRMLAYGAVSVLKCIGSTCMGEARHLHSNSEERLHNTRSIRLSAPPSNTVRQSVDSKGYNRNAFYARGAIISLESWKYVLRAIGPIYRHRDWAGGYGGKKWGEINTGAKRVAVNLSKFRKSPSAKNWALVVAEWNSVIHKEHNGRAPALNKFYVQRNDMDNLARFPLAGLPSMGESKLNILMNGPSAGMVKSGASKLVIPARKRAEGKRVLRTVEVRTIYSQGYVHVYQGDRIVAKARVLDSVKVDQINGIGYTNGKLVIEQVTGPSASAKPLDTLAKALGVESPGGEQQEGQYVVVNNVKLDITSYYGV